MSATIKMFKVGKGGKGSYHFRIAVSDKRRSVQSRFLEQIGYYNPTKNPPLVKIDKEKALKWLKNGALPSDTVKSLFKKEGIYK
jgi:small subunit ribosomal protein S16